MKILMNRNNSYFKMKKQLSLLLITYGCFSALFVNAEPTTVDYVAGYTGLGLSFAGGFLFRDALAPETPHITNPGGFDTHFRNSLKWGDDQLVIASLTSDALFWLGTLPSVLWTPLLSDYDYSSHLLLNFQVLAATGFLTHVAKFAVGRQRPSAYFGTWDSLGSHDNLSFFSGHASISFATATSTAYILSQDHPDDKFLIWAVAMSVATTTSYLRVAADLHYTSDVLAGAAVGVLVGYLVPKLQFDHFFSGDSSEDFQVGFQFSF